MQDMVEKILVQLEVEKICMRNMQYLRLMKYLEDSLKTEEDIKYISQETVIDL